MKPGRELDKLIAEKVMGWKWDENTAWSPSGSRNSRHGGIGKDDPWWWLPSYSTDIGAGWEVVEHMRAKHWRDVLILSSPDSDGPNSFFWRAQFVKKFSCPPDEESSEAETAPEAICLAALKAVGAG